MTTERFNQISQGKFPGFLGIKVLTVEKDHLVAEMPIRPEFLAPNGFLHAGSLVSLADTLAGYASVANLPEGATSFTTIELKSNFFRTLTEGVVIAETRAEHLGRTTHVWQVEVKDQATGKKLALFSCTQMMLYPRS
ncbi:MAG: PaaI family thioesterase [Bacteroidota bacterium]